MIVVYTEKPFITRTLASHFAEKFPNQKIIYINSMYYMNVSFDFSKNIKWEQFPLLQSPVFKIANIDKWNTAISLNGCLSFTDVSFEDIITCEKIIYAAESIGSSPYLFKIFIEQVFQKSLEEVNPLAIRLFSLDSKSIANEIENMKSFSSYYAQEVKSGELSKYFDYNYNFNSLALFGKVINETQKRFPENLNLGNRLFVAKNMMQLLYFIMRNESAGNLFSVNNLIGEMYHWKGTGKYSGGKRVSLGSVSSSFTIISNWLDYGFIQLNEGKLSLSEKGNFFISLLPKDCMDLDLPFRLSVWKDDAKTDFSSSKEKVDKYLFSYFNKVKNKCKGFSQE